MGLFNKESKEEKAVNELIDKKTMLMNAVQKEINTINSQILNEQQNIGIIIYENYIENNSSEIDSYKYVDKLTKIDELKANIKEKELKLQEICDRYDDEIKILKQSLGMNETNCPSCGKAYNPSVDKFCMNCGQKLG